MSKLDRFMVLQYVIQFSKTKCLDLRIERQLRAEKNIIRFHKDCVVVNQYI